MHFFSIITPTLRFPRALRLAMILALIAVTTVACERSVDEVADGNPVVQNGPRSPSAGGAPPDRAKRSALTIEGGRFTDDRLTVRQDEPTVIHITNKDSQGYRVRFEGVVAEEEIAPAGITDVSFTAPNPVEVEGQLLATDSNRVIDTIQFVVQAPGGVEP